MQATDELAAELEYLVGAVAKGEKVTGGDLPSLLAIVIEKFKVSLCTQAVFISQKVFTKSFCKS